MNRVWIELDAKALEHNIRVYRDQLPKGCKIMGVVKANAYGHGAKPVSAFLEAMGIDHFAVATLEEGVEIRESGIKSDILILGYTAPEYFGTIAAYDLTQTITDADYGRELEDLCRVSGVKIKAHVAVDSGMHRIGVPAGDMDAIRSLCRSRDLNVTGIFSHLCVADTQEEEHVEFSHKQIATFKNVVDALKKDGSCPGTVHLLASHAAVNYDDVVYDYARLGILMFGVNSSWGDWLRHDLKPMPVMQLKAHITSVREIGVGESVSYGRVFRADRPTKVASVAMGYADGMPRCLSGKLRAMVNGTYVPQIGRICMDQLMLDVTDAGEVKAGDVATFIGRDGDCVIYAEELADKAGTITNELFSRLGSRMEGRIFVK